MNRIILCSILLNDSPIERQIISWDEDDHLLYSSACDEPVDNCECDTVEDAVNACKAIWGLRAWDLQWSTYIVKPEFYDLWGAYDGFNEVTVDRVAELSNEWETPLCELFQQLET